MTGVRGAARLHLVTGAAGFVANCLIGRLLAAGDAVVGFDNLSRGTLANIATFANAPAFAFQKLDVSDRAALADAFAAALAGHPDYSATVWHLAANSDIQAGVENPDIDLRDTFMTTFSTLDAMRRNGLRVLAFASTSAVYGPLTAKLREDIGPLFPISNYGAMKLASEAAISAAVEAHLERAWIFRFPNVVGSAATHGALYDFAGKLRRTPDKLEVLGDGNQQKAYLLVEELVDAMLFICAHAADRLNCFNIGPLDAGVTVRFLAEEMVRHAAPSAQIRYTGGDRGWVGDVPRFSYSVKKLRRLGWSPKTGSAGAVRAAVPVVWQESK
ncbi:MAG: NAD-dependent epimerase/dehydratase family protein [Alphaproteobacteria bacterium]|nr:NAD-dependent epimerase/dehydratase family protein [Alphaproteobacteria bacterium]MBU6471558.1 NAD-dependent epimerase/dehydratase family protein [Alphaproteobacteria bacterium]MDE2012318.1 NAD-dependent epimerase/dehydratase family protein [Alphaproteobacteria bacterium]MDE2072991.1 NAD-dependent epimerase/dehydratase family protein [Alphaproteobacteria bacterium]MDE2352076.1 NAD-dependent epimerase/dehydratase family protein [Alphaproteobacteria bacterium]